MKFIADAGISVDMVELIRSKGHECTHARDLPPGTPDDEVLALAVSGSQAVITTDKDFGELVFKYSLPVVGVLLLRVRKLELESERIERLESHWDQIVAALPGHFVTLARGGVRTRPLD